MKSLNVLKNHILKAVEKLSINVDRGLLIFHDDADGVVSAFMLKSTLETLDWSVDLVCLEKLYPQALDLMSKTGEYSLIAFADLGSPHSKTISSKLRRCYDTILIVDHHDPVRVDDEKIIHINPELYGYSGEEEASASTTSYLIAKEVVSGVEEVAFLAVVGSAEIPGALRGLNSIPLSDALNVGSVELRGGNKYIVDFYGEKLEHWRASSILSTIASIGYYREGPKYAIEACKRGFTESIKKFQLELEGLRRKFFKRGFGIAYKSMKVRGDIQWFHIGRLFYNVGAKALGLLTSQIAYRGRVERNKYLFGMMVLNPKIPGLGVLTGDWVKISGRTPETLKESIVRGASPPINKLMEEACKRLGGFADGHSYAASGIIPSGLELEFVEEVGKLLR